MSPKEMVHKIQKRTLWPLGKIAKEIGITPVTLCKVRNGELLKPMTICKVENFYEKLFKIDRPLGDPKET